MKLTETHRILSNKLYDLNSDMYEKEYNLNILKENAPSVDNGDLIKYLKDLRLKRKYILKEMKDVKKEIREIDKECRKYDEILYICRYHTERLCRLSQKKLLLELKVAEFEKELSGEKTEEGLAT
jgi:hypothetical protein